MIGRLGGAFGLPEEGVAVSVAHAAQAAAAERQVQDSASRCAERSRRAGSRVPGPADQPGRGGPLGASRPRSRPAASRRFTCSILARADRSATCPGSSPRSARGRSATADCARACCMTELAKAADVVLPGASWVEKDSTYVNQQGTVQGAARVIAPPGDAQEDWQILVERRPRARRRRYLRRQRRDPRGAAGGVARQPDATPSWLDRLREAGPGPDLAAGLEPFGALEVGLHVPGPAAGEVRRAPRPVVAPGCAPAERSQVGLDPRNPRPV